MFSTLALLACGASAIGQQAPTLDQALGQWRGEHGDAWRIDVDEGTGYAEFLFGGSVPAPFEPQTDADWFTLARHALALSQDLHGIEPLTLVEHATQFLPLGMVGTTDKMTVKLRQTVGGVPVDGGWVNVLFDAEGRLLSVQTRALPAIAGLDVAPAYGADDAAALALAAFERDTRLVGAVVAEPELVVAQLDLEELRLPRLAYKATVQWLPADTAPEGYTYFLDARDGAVVQREDAIHYFDVGGTVYTMATPGVAPDGATNPETQQVMKYARVQSSAGTTFTDANGNFNYVGQTGPLNCTFNYTGSFNQVNNSGGSPYSLQQSLSGTGNSVVLNPSSQDLVTAQANAFQGVNAVRDWVRMVNPADSHADFVHTANVNITSTCNAFFNGNSINFYQTGGGCANTAYSTVVAHEDGHWLNVLYGTGNGSDGMGEGNADVWAMYVFDHNIVGMNFCGNGCHVRNGLNNNQFCGDCCGGCYGEVHADGEPWMGAAWKVRRNLNNTLGNAAGDAVADALFLGWMNSYNQTQIKSVIETQWLTLDDNDGNINNGTPNFADIDAGFTEQGFPGVMLIPIQITNVTQLPPTQNQTGPYVVGATLVSNVGSTVTGANVFYRVGSSGTFASVAMANVGGNDWSGSIPGQTAPAKVYYYVQASDALGNTGKFPANAPTTTLSFPIGLLAQVFCDDFESAQGWTVVNSSLTSGAWERGDPIGTLQGASQAQPEFDDPAGSGTMCMFTDQGSPGSSNVGEADVDGGPTTMTSPAFDLSVGNGEISYAYWMYNDDGDDSLVVQLSNNGSTWVTARSYVGGGGGWAYDSIDVGAFVAPTASVQVRFQTADQPNDSITEAAIDSLCVYTLGPVGCTGTPTVFCTGKVNSQFCLPGVAHQGIPSASGPNPFTISVDQVINNKTGLLFYGYGTNNAPFQGGVLCCAAPVRRTPVQNSGGSPTGNDCTGTLSYDFNARIQSGLDPLLLPGQTCAAQFYYRDPGDPHTIGLSNAVSFSICP
jgi:hypothetical protein